MTTRIAPTEFLRLRLRCHTLLSDVPLHDVWTISLTGGGPGRTISDVRPLLFSDQERSINQAVRGLFALRLALGRLLRWDDERHDPPAGSYLERLTDSDRSQSLVAPGRRDGAFRVLYVFANESVNEIRNATVHAFLALALTPCAAGYMLYLAIYVRPVSRLTPFYMAVIDPFRRFLVYPALGRQVQQGWASRYG